MHLIQEIGVDYFRDRFNGAMFMGPNNLPCYVNSASGSYTGTSVPAVEVQGTPARVKVTNIEIPYDFFTSMEVFSAPELGWRCAAKGRYLAYYSRNNNSYQRGVSLNNVTRIINPITHWASAEGLIDFHIFEREANKTLLVMRPEFTPFSEGVAQLREGKILSFCVSPNTAVVHDENDTLSIMFNQNKVGTVTATGDIDCKIPFVINDLQLQEKQA